MARPRKTLFYEENLPKDLNEKEKWLVTYHLNCKLLVEYVLSTGAKSTVYYYTIRCLLEFKSYLLANELPYSRENTIRWYNETGPHPHGYLAVLSRLDDIYTYGAVQPVNAFPIVLSYEKELKEPWKDILSDYRQSLHFSELYESNVKNCASRFLYHIQEMGIFSAEQITYDVLEVYFRTERHRSNRMYIRYMHAAGDVLLFMADRGMCPRALGLYPYYRTRNRILHKSDCSADQIGLLEKIKSDGFALNNEEYERYAGDFLETYIGLGYSESQCSVAKNALYSLMLFMGLNEYGYHKIVAEIWLEHEKQYYKSEGWGALLRIFKLFDLYVENKTISPEIIFRDNHLQSDLLPSWCREEITAYLDLKRKEKWRESSLNMMRSSITRFCVFLSEYGLESFSQLTSDLLTDFNISDHHATAEGKNAYNVRIRRFLQYLERKEIIPYGLHKALLSTAGHRERIVVILNEEEIAAINEKHENCVSPLDYRDKAIMMLGIKMGLRGSDIVAIKFTDINWKEQTLRIIQKKTDYEINLPIPTDVANAVYLYIKNGRPNEKSSSEYIFIKNKVPYDSVSKSVCLDALKRTLPERNVAGSGFHVTRKTYATERLRNGAGRQGIADLLGHKSMESLTPYLLVDEERMRMCPISLKESNLLIKGERYDNI